MTREHPSALLVIVDALVIQHGRQILDFAVRSRIPSMLDPGMGVTGALLGYGPSLSDLNDPYTA